MNYTVIGGRGFIGSKIVEKLEQIGSNVWVPKKQDSELLTKDLGTVIFCAGHGDCNNGFLKVLESNTVLLGNIVEKAYFTKLVYISSTRLYMGQSKSKETSDLTVLAGDSRRLFNLTKLVAEEILLKSNKNIVIVRPSNVYGMALNSPLYLPAIIRNAINNNVVDMYVTKTYSKDYVSVNDVAEAICKLSIKKRLSYDIYNVASGYNVSSLQIANILEKHTNCKIIWHDSDIEEEFPVTDISRITDEISFRPRAVLDDFPLMISGFKKALLQ